MEIDGRNRVIIEGVTPEIDGGRFAAKRVAGDVVTVEADIFADGHDLISAVVRYRRPGESEWRDQRMKALVNDRWRAELPLEALGIYHFTIDAWIDHFLSWHGDLRKRVDAGQDVAVELLVGRAMIEAAVSRAKGRDKKRLRSWLEDLDGEGSADERADALFDDDLVALMARNAERTFVTSLGRELPIEVDRPRAGFSSWYELFPRSTGKPGEHGSFATAADELPRIAAMGFDVVYLPPIHPIGTTHRKGVDNATAASVVRERYHVEPVVQDGQVRFHIAAGETFLPDFVRTFPQRLLSVGLRRPTLDDVFLTLTGHEIRDSELDAKDLLLQGMGRWGRR